MYMAMHGCVHGPMQVHRSQSSHMHFQFFYLKGSKNNQTPVATIAPYIWISDTGLQGKELGLPIEWADSRAEPGAACGPNSSDVFRLS